MKREEINNYFIENYLTCGKTKDNFITTSCPKDFLITAKECLSSPDNNIKPINIYINKNNEIVIEKTLDNCSDDFHKKILARDYITSLIMLKIYQQLNLYPTQIQSREEHIQAFNENNFKKIIELHTDCPMPFEITRCYKKYGKFEINFFLDNTENKFLQQAINNLISERNPISIKIFATMQNLPTYLDECGNLIQSPHDYLQLNINHFIINPERQIN
ncbi:MAG: hypothetical protein IJW59_05495 [Clostridia bacterium]|nr:hypothetical protein [Clostridia bacterium]